MSYFGGKMRAELIVDREHLDRVLGLFSRATVELWIATATLKALFVEAPIGTAARARGRFVSILETLRALKNRGVDVRILHGAPPSGPFVRSQRALGADIAMRQCPRVHLKMIAVDGQTLYLGSANLTGAGLGAKNEGRRNFEMGILTTDEHAIERAQGRFDAIWSGRECGPCKMRRLCPAPIDQLGKKKKVTAAGSSPRASRSPASPSRSSSRRP